MRPGQPAAGVGLGLLVAQLFRQLQRGAQVLKSRVALADRQQQFAQLGMEFAALGQRFARRQMVGAGQRLAEVVHALHVGEQLLVIDAGQQVKAQGARPIFAQKGVVGDLVGGLRCLLLQQFGQIAVEFAPLGEQQRFVRNFLRRLLPERIAAVVGVVSLRRPLAQGVVGHNEIALGQGVGLVDEGGPDQMGRVNLGQQAQLEAIADDAGHFDRWLVAVGESVQAGQDDAVDGVGNAQADCRQVGRLGQHPRTLFRHQRIGRAQSIDHAGGENPLPLVVTQLAGLTQRLDQLARKERVALSLGLDEQTGQQRWRSAQQTAHQLPYAIAVEFAQGQQGVVAQGAQIDQRLGLGIRLRRRANDGYDHDRRVVAALGQRFQQTARGLIHPVGILEDQQQRLRPRPGVDNLQHEGEQRLLPLARVKGGGGRIIFQGQAQHVA